MGCGFGEVGTATSPPPQANGVGIAANPTLACIGSGRVWAIAFPGVVLDNIAAVMRFRAPRYHRTEGASIVMLVASGLIGLGREACSDHVVTHNPVAPKDRRSTPGDPTPARSRQAVGSSPKTFSFHLAVPRLASALSRFPDLVSGPKSFPSTVRLRPLETGLPIARLSLHLRFAKLVPGNLRGVFSDRAADIAFGSSGYVFPFGFRGFPLHPPVRFPV